MVCRCLDLEAQLLWQDRGAGDGSVDVGGTVRAENTWREVAYSEACGAERWFSLLPKPGDYCIRAVGDLLCAGCEGCSYNPVVNILDKSVSRNQAWIALELPNDLLVQCAFFFFFSPGMLYPENSLVFLFSSIHG